ncbi:MAG: hypothetical protein ACMXX7_01170 [Candidatus Woesearchaeota archaeon]
MRIKHLLLVLAIISTLTIFIVDVSANFVEQTERFGMTVNQLKDVTNLNDINEISIPFYASCILAHGSTNNYRARSETHPIANNYAACRAMEWNFGSAGTRNRRIRNYQNPDAVTRLPGSVASLLYDDQVPDYRYHHRGRGNNPYLGLVAMQPPFCPLFISRFPTYSQGGSDFCLCGNNVVKTGSSTNALCIDNIYHSNSNMPISEGIICASENDKGCGSNSYGGVFRAYPTSYNSNNVQLRALPSFSQELRTINFNYDQNNIFSEAIPLFASRLHGRRSFYSATQTFSFWFYVEEDKENVRRIVTKMTQNNAKIEKKLIRLKNVNPANNNWEFEIIGSAGDISVGANIHRQGTSSDTLIMDFEDDEYLKQGWYFFKFTITNARSNNLHTRSLKFETTFRTFSANDPGNIIPFSNVWKYANSNGPLSFDLTLFEDDEDMASWACENDPYFPGHWADEWLENEEGIYYTEQYPIQRRCCGNNPLEDVGFRNPVNNEVCSGNLNDLTWGDTAKCVDETGNEIDGTHYNSDLLLCCGVSNESSLPKNVGFVGPSDGNYYACFDNGLAGSEEGDISYTSNSEHIWRSASIWRSTIMQINNTFEGQDFKMHYVANNDGWHYCNANNYDFGFGNSVFEGETVNATSSAADSFSCSVNLASILTIHEDFSPTTPPGVSISDCEQGLDDCKFDAASNGLDGFCLYSEVPLTFEPGEFFSTCQDDCYVRTSSDFVPMNDYILDEIEDVGNDISNICSLDVFSDLSICVTGSDQVPNLCFLDPDAKECGLIPSHMSCSLLLSSFYPGENIDYEDRLCNEDQICAGGVMAQTNNDGSPSLCCLGRNAACQDIEQTKCSDLGPGWNVKPGNEYECRGGQTFVGAEECCSVEWTPFDQIDSFSPSSFLCYKQGHNSFFKECAANPHNVYVRNDNTNPLANIQNFNQNFNMGLFNVAYRQITPSGGRLQKSPLVAQMGEPLFPIFNQGIFVTQRYDFGGTDPYVFLTGSQDFRWANLRLKDWSSFNELRFDIVINSDNITHFVVEGDEYDLYFSFEDYAVLYKGPMRAMHVIIPINDSSVWENVVNLKIKRNQVSGSNSFIIDNIHLVDNQGVNNSKNRYCSSDWGKWIENLDGSDDEGFFFFVDNYNDDLECDEDPDLCIETVPFIKYAPYQAACNAQPSFGWTGTLCCGDDTNKTNNGEYWVDTNGVCWAGTTIRNDRSIAHELGAAVNQSGKIEIEKSLLYLNNEIYACNDDPDNMVYDQPFIFDGVNAHDELNFSQYINDSNTRRSFEVEGSWVCLDNEWRRITDIGRSRLMAATLLNIATSRDNKGYALSCSDMEEIANYVKLYDNGNAEDGMLRRAACSLRLKQEESVLQDQVFVAIELKRRSTQGYSSDFEKFQDTVLKHFQPFGQVHSFNCPDLEEDKFFVECKAEDSDGDTISLSHINNFRVYYNEVFNIALISNTNLASTGLVQLGEEFAGVWATIRNFFRNLLGLNNQGEPLPSSSLPTEFEDGTRTFFKQINNITGDEREILSFILPTNQGPIIKAEYKNIDTDISFFVNVTKAHIDADNITGTSVNTEIDVSTLMINLTGINHNDKLLINTWKMLTTGTRLDRSTNDVSIEVPEVR